MRRPAEEGRPATGSETSSGSVPLLERIAAARLAYRLPLEARTLADEFASGVLALLFPHFTRAERCDPGALPREREQLMQLLHRVLEPLAAEGSASAQELCDRFDSALPGIYEALLLDAQAIYDADPAAESEDEVILAYPGFYAIAIYRVAHEFYQWGVPLFPRLLTELAHRQTGIDIHPGARIGSSFSIDHGTGVVIGETAVLGDRVRIFQGVTVGAASVRKGMRRTKRHPTIGNDVVIYSHATILGGDTVVGDGSVVGGNVWLTHSLPAGSVVTRGAEVKSGADVASADMPDS